MSTLAGVALSKAAPEAACDRCGATEDVGRLTLSFPPGVLACREQTTSFHLCVWCQAELLGLSTGFKTGQQLRRWYDMRRLARQKAGADDVRQSSWLRGGRAVDR